MNVLTTTKNYTVREAFRKEDYSFSVDWLNVRLDSDNLESVLNAICIALPELDVSDFIIRESGGVCFYKEALYLSNIGYSSFVINFNRDEYGNIINKGEKRGDVFGIMLSVSGDGCRYINSLHNNAFMDFIEALVPFNPHCSRIDVACDIFDPENMVTPIIQTFADCAFDRDSAPIDFKCGIRRTPTFVTCNLVWDTHLHEFTRNVTIGGRSSKKGTLQLYNKRVEIECGRLKDVSEAILNSVGNPEYWWRLEYRCKSFAQNVFDNLIQSKSIYSAFLQACDDMGIFVIPRYSNDISKAEDCLDWLAFLAFVKKLNNNIFISCSSQCVNIPFVGSELSRIEKFHIEQIPSSDAINLLMLLFDSDYRTRVYDCLCQQITYNRKLKPALQELCIKYGLKLEEVLDLTWSQSSLFADIA